LPQVSCGNFCRVYFFLVHAILQEEQKNECQLIFKNVKKFSLDRVFITLLNSITRFTYNSVSMMCIMMFYVFVLEA